jgi:hypothetical protein
LEQVVIWNGSWFVSHFLQDPRTRMSHDLTTQSDDELMPNNLKFPHARPFPMTFGLKGVHLSLTEEAIDFHDG